MDEIEVNGNDAGLNFNGEADDPFAIPPPLDSSLLADDPFNIIGPNEAENPQDNVDGDPTEESAEKKKKKRAFKPRVNLNEERLCSQKGINALKNLCSDDKFKGKGHEVSDLNKLLHRFEHWAQCLMPRWPFDNVVQKCEVLGTKYRVKSELKRIRRDEEEILQGEPENDEEGIEGADGQGETTNEENPTEATATQQDIAQEERPPAELTEEQHERIRRNRVLAFERREAKRRRLEEESQTQSQTEDLTNAEQPMNQENSSEQPSLANVTPENVGPEENLEDTMHDKIHEDIATNVDQNGSTDNLNDEAGLTNVPDIDHNVGSHIDTNERNDSSQLSNVDSEREQEVNNDDMSDEDDEILSKSMFDLNPTSQDAPSPVDTNSELSLNSRDNEVLQNNSHPNDVIEDNTPLLENERLQTNSPSSDNATANTNTSSLEMENADLPDEPSKPTPENTDGESTEQMDVDSPTIE